MYILLIFGLIIGSFLSAFTYRYPRNISINKGRSVCPKCKAKIKWYDNIPLISFLILKGKCRNCAKKISIRYPAIEAATALLFVLVGYFIHNCDTINSPICELSTYLSYLTIPYFLLILSILVAIFVIDLEHQIIPDALTFLLLILVVLPLVLLPYPHIYMRLVAGFVPSLVLLFLALVTKGKGMGLGDVKFVLPAGILVGWPGSVYYLYTAFLTGALVGIILLIAGNKSMKSKIAFGPFLVLSLIMMLFFGNHMKLLLLV